MYLFENYKCQDTVHLNQSFSIINVFHLAMLACVPSSFISVYSHPGLREEDNGDRPDNFVIALLGQDGHLSEV